MEKLTDVLVAFENCRLEERKYKMIVDDINKVLNVLDKNNKKYNKELSCLSQIYLVSNSTLLKSNIVLKVVDFLTKESDLCCTFDENYKFNNNSFIVNIKLNKPANKRYDSVPYTVEFDASTNSYEAYFDMD